MNPTASTVEQILNTYINLRTGSSCRPNLRIAIRKTSPLRTKLDVCANRGWHKTVEVRQISHQPGADSERTTASPNMLLRWSQNALPAVVDWDLLENPGDVHWLWYPTERNTHILLPTLSTQCDSTLRDIVLKKDEISTEPPASDVASDLLKKMSAPESLDCSLVFYDRIFSASFSSYADVCGKIDGNREYGVLMTGYHDSNNCIREPVIPLTGDLRRFLVFPMMPTYQKFCDKSICYRCGLSDCKPMQASLCKPVAKFGEQIDNHLINNQ
ncbi:hypothetical protein CLF_100729 [Clonorchis sinensis]|uniref:Uncharacterized protein n=1 Tax=Clonorchis sinensis TaxID=79923 RepID=G7Y441_CLOSI|nr:hypothetical protein CLF_100729 [Clonorchis sinensis]